MLSLDVFDDSYETIMEHISRFVDQVFWEFFQAPKRLMFPMLCKYWARFVAFSSSFSISQFERCNFRKFLRLTVSARFFIGQIQLAT